MTTEEIDAFSRVTTREDLDTVLEGLPRSFRTFGLLKHRVYSAIIWAKNPSALRLFIGCDTDFCAEHLPHLFAEMRGIMKPDILTTRERIGYTHEEQIANCNFWRTTVAELCEDYGIDMPWQPEILP